MRALVSTAWSGPENARQRHEVIGLNKMISGIEQEIRIFGSRSGISARDPRQVATTVMAMLDGWIEYVAPTCGQPEEEVERFAYLAVDLLIRGTGAW